MSSQAAARILVILSPGEGADGTEFARFLAVYYALRDSDVEVILASTDGGYPWSTRPDRGADAGAELVQRFQADAHARDDTANTLPLREVFVEDFDGGFCIGLPGAIWRGNEGGSAAALIACFLEVGKPVAVLPSLFDITPRGAGQGLLIIGDGDWPPWMAVTALLAALPQRTQTKGIGS